MTKILIIEDDEAIAELEKDYLKLNGYEVDISNDGREGLVMALNGAYDLFIVDIMLPEVDGFEICSKIREKKETPLLLVSAKKDDIDKIRGLGLGADDYITKPFSPSELVARVGSHLARFERIAKHGLQNGTSEEMLRVKSLIINKAQKKVSVNGDEIKLTVKEYDLLLFLAEHPNTVFSKEDLFYAVWNVDYGDVSTVTVHVKKLREKIELNPSNPQFIETIWGVGYRFKV